MRSSQFARCCGAWLVQQFPSPYTPYLTRSKEKIWESFSHHLNKGLRNNKRFALFILNQTQWRLYGEEMVEAFGATVIDKGPNPNMAWINNSMIYTCMIVFNESEKWKNPTPPK